MPAGPAASRPQTEARPFPHGGTGVTRMAKASERQIALGRRTARVCCSIDGRCIAAEVLKNPLNHARILDAGDHPQLPAATSANLCLVQVALYVYVFHSARLYSDMILHVIYVGLQLYGWYHWARGGLRLGESLPVTRLSPSRFAATVAATIAGAWLW